MSKFSVPKLKPLKVKCTDSDCKNDLHCFKATQKLKKEGKEGACRSCGVELINWDRVHEQDMNDVDYTFDALRSELIRHHFWHKEIDQRAINHAKRKGKSKLWPAIENRIRKSVADAHPVRDGQQTPMEGNSIYYAQHATACCCRTCIEYWHQIPKGVELTDGQVGYFTELCMRFLNERMPYLTNDGEHVPPIRKK
ncbi:DUF4186 family protein [uncultured Gimesia sp.]|uniref:DUF4186 family protein n=1 Tax=uncultured Gimesia sp. TaxID=1678688 RepID=UPI0030DA2608|tara:strand:- start:38299 stop:38886 length:588 start_codon:yes stop_codon:yes gene_type:complete